MKNILALLLAFCGVLYASYSRIESMGKTDFYFEDDMNMFVNPANMALHSSFIFGELGTTMTDSALITDPYVIRETAYNPWFGGVFSKDLKNESRFSVGMAFNRDDKWVSLMNGIIDLANTDTVFKDNSGIGPMLPKVINKVDLAIAYRHPSRFSVGALIYGGANRDNQTQISVAENYSKREAFMVKGILGVTKHFMNNFFLEGSFGTSVHDFTYRSFDQTLQVKPRKGLNLFGHLRMFVPLSDRFSLVPVANFEQVLQGHQFTDIGDVDSVLAANDVNDYLDVSGGFGFNFFEAEKKTQFIFGMDGHFLKAQNDRTITVNGAAPPDGGYSGGKSEDLYGVFTFGIERQLYWNWLVVRAGGRKVFGISRTVTTTTSKIEQMWENPATNNSRSDLIGVGLGVNFLRKLQLDFTLSEDIPYSILYVVSGVSGNVFTRFSCSYYF
ncbi:MAG: hypothetical protein A2268_12595 [Candidatus Raymondbacteria bacterium RifOxyA12_full_50_37]|uniref:Uncharacterized protein n=1 Tax=Candidatus Raymondbacteria bacterium RIFOXYD12_FULL_49_13 TaxID=1817890 RepID=A0A1F7FB79_UNCRA|nr:MAG: hypothetical protein A2268_12595 [Candidatus Raymondbacteria bacterium RifOxyA12_full_50_37]OGJ91015.1 MAG: hypothetical protein A2248_00615 [Candidatus Raymondbacteria bacterium RIFOXYA2_FULL_49_16]OGJ97452.1 MAG: hypothetical protein A2453_10165 [Candidatus Raymondbacteria bacterium RIFOXYC2_FULL_50_21]OGJ99716.1 MAG: hypothetical protein A2350_08870 [Candidatus Raymondbacteria bacterium RifOxyB12_full_50_8]OGK03878.1 MAG: hypothetical protein A2519_00550 [Candidatus Raymondbacteria b